jgi:hypothetical protein
MPPAVVRPLEVIRPAASKALVYMANETPV